MSDPKLDGVVADIVSDLRAQLSEQSHLVRDLGTKLANHRERASKLEVALREILERDVPDATDHATCHRGLCERSQCLRCQRVDRAWELFK